MFLRIFTIAFDRLFQVRLQVISGARNSTNATVKIRRNAPSEALSRKGLYPNIVVNGTKMYMEDSDVRQKFSCLWRCVYLE